MGNNNQKQSNEQRGYWGKYHTINGVTRKIYIGILTREEMIEYDDTFRHNFAIEPPKIETVKEN